jgi:hypothetical protein
VVAIQTGRPNTSSWRTIYALPDGEFPSISSSSPTLNERESITAEAFAAIEATLPLGSSAAKPKVNEEGEREIWLDGGVLNRLGLMRGPGESYSDVILRLAADDPFERT